MKHFRLKIIFTTLLAVGFIVAFGWIVAWQNCRSLSREASNEKIMTREAAQDALKNLTASWNDDKTRITNRYETEAVFASLALQRAIDNENASEAVTQENSAVISIEEGELSPADPAIRRLGLDASLLHGRKGSFAAPNDPSIFAVYSRIGDSSDYFVKWYEDTVIEDVVEENLDIPGILKRTEIAYDIPAMFVSCDPDSGEISGILYKNDRYFADCEDLEDLGLTPENLKKNDTEASGTLSFDGTGFAYAFAKSERPVGYVIMLEPELNLYAKAFGQAGYMIAALIILVVTLLVSGFSLYPYVRNNILTPEEEATYCPSHVHSLVSLFGIFGLIVIVLCGMFIYALSGLYDDVARGRERLDMVEDSISMYAERYSQNLESFHDVYLDFGNHIAEFLDASPELRKAETLSLLAESISASSITLYDSDGCETVSSGPWVGLELGTDPESSTFDFRRILKGVPYLIHDPETDEVTGLNEMRFGIRIRDEKAQDRYGVMILCVDIPAMTNHDINPEMSVRQIFQNISDPETTLWIADAKTGQILVSGTEELEGRNITDVGLGESDLKGSLVKTLNTEEGDAFVTSVYMETPGIPGWTRASDGIIAYYRGPKTVFLSGMFSLALTGGLLFCVIYSILAWILIKTYSDEFFNKYKHVKGSDDPKKKLNPLRRAMAGGSPGRRGMAAMEIATAAVLLQILPFAESNSSAVRNTVYYYILAGDWERGFNLFAIAAILILLAKVVLLVIGVRLLLTICASFAGSKGRTIFRLIANVALYIALFYFLIKATEYLGFSTTAIAASMGSLALAISLGAQNFVADIFAGLTYVFEGTVHVGDNVEIALMGAPVLHGKIVEIGVRCIKVMTMEGDLITCGNRDIKMIRNSTQMNSHVICEMVVSAAYSAEEIEQILKAELPKIGRTDRKILSGPAYNGIIAIGNGTMTLSVSAECSEENYSYVRDKLNVSLQRIFTEHGFSI